MLYFIYFNYKKLKIRKLKLMRVYKKFYIIFVCLNVEYDQKKKNKMSKCWENVCSFHVRENLISKPHLEVKSMALV